MLALEILDIKDFTSKLFVGNVFDTFCLSEAAFTTFLTCTIDGKLKKDFFDSGQAPDDRSLSLWSEVKPYCYTLIRGRRTPLHFKIVFQLSPKNTEKMLHSSGASLTAEDVFGLFLNCQFEKGRLICTTGTSLKVFSTDRTVDQLWDDLVRRFFRQQKISFEER
ncbi:MAG TPA: hypothetical protein IAA63_04000 [Candidatus Pullilachnospira stercoravium]|uniref:Uncharacterized protein n=1 Tax=Candidatus Pullilachnospira stercoravium TaxID=2840913 RepID=A0A9D1NU02_9FIRM|nr:hypothetical protein [Candidatus Pullilachnospira stercoravium]